MAAKTLFDLKYDHSKRVNSDIDSIREELSGLNKKLLALKKYSEDAVDNIQYNVEEKLDIALEAVSYMYAKHIMYNNAPYTKDGRDEKELESFGKFEIADEIIMFPITLKWDDTKYIVYGTKDGCGAMVVPSTGEEGLSLYDDFVKSLTSSDVAKELLLGVLLSAPKDPAMTYEYKKSELNSLGEVTHFKLNYHGFKIIMYTETGVCGNRWIDIEKDGYCEHLIGPLHRGLDYKKVFEEEMLDPQLLEKLELPIEAYRKNMEG